MLCRACGAEMVASEYCSDCNEATLWKCGSCSKENDKSIHTFHPPREEQASSKAASVVGALVSITSGFGVIMVPL